MRVYKAEEYLDPNENINVFKKDKCIEGIHTHDFIELVYILTGDGVHKINGESYNVTKGDMLFININQTHSIFSENYMKYVNFLLKPEFFSSELVNDDNIFDVLTLSIFHEFKDNIENASPIISLRGHDIIQIESIIENMLTEFSEKKPGYKPILHGQMMILFAKMFREMKSLEDGNAIGYINRITPEIINYIEENCFEKLTLKEISDKCFYNPSYFSRKFKECYGKSLTAYIQEKRISEAQRLLVNSTISVEDICFRVGYIDRKLFYKLFKEYTGFTPNQYRIQKKPT